MKFDTFLFDWDGCLVDTLSVWMKAYKELFSEYGLFPTEDEIISIFGIYEGPEQLGVANSERFMDMLYSRVEDTIISAPLHPFVVEVITDIKKNKRTLAIVTSSPRSSIVPVLERNGLQDSFELILDKYDVTCHKPDPEIVISAIARLQSDVHSTIIIGDSQNDILAGKNAGVSTGLFFPEINQRFYKSMNLRSFEPDYVFDSFAEIRSLLH